MEKTVDLKDGTPVSVRPVERDDAERLYWFLGGLTEEDRKFLRFDIRNRDLILDRIRGSNPDLVFHMIAEADTNVVALGLLETPGPGWDEDVGEMRIFVGPNSRRNGLGFVLARELYFIAIEKRLRKIMARIMRPQSGARKIFKRLGFMEEVLLPEFVKDLDGNVQDLFIMTADLDDMKRELKAIFESSDWRRHR